MLHIVGHDAYVHVRGERSISPIHVDVPVAFRTIVYLGGASEPQRI